MHAKETFKNKDENVYRFAFWKEREKKIDRDTKW